MTEFISESPGRAVPCAPRLEGRVALITGASGGIGSAVALRMAQDGARLFLTYGKNHEGAEATRAACLALGVEVEVLSLDLKDPAAAPQLIQAVLHRFGGLQILVQCAGQAQEALLATLSDEELEALLQLNVSALVRIARAALRPMLLQRSGSLVHLSSVLAQRPSQGCAVYAGSKGFVESFTRALAVEVGRKGVRVNAVAPGVVETPMNAAVRGLLGAALPARTSLKRLGSPTEIAAAIAFLASDDASYVTGEVITVDGGYLGPP